MKYKIKFINDGHPVAPNGIQSDDMDETDVADSTFVGFEDTVKNKVSQLEVEKIRHTEVAVTKMNLHFLAIHQDLPALPLIYLKSKSNPPPCKWTLTGWGTSCTLTVGAAGCTLMVGAAGCGLLGQGVCSGFALTSQNLLNTHIQYCMAIWPCQINYTHVKFNLHIFDSYIQIYCKIEFSCARSFIEDCTVCK
jgi:hypothetical protein